MRDLVLALFVLFLPTFAAVGSSDDRVTWKWTLPESSQEFHEAAMKSLQEPAPVMRKNQTTVEYLQSWSPPVLIHESSAADAGKSDSDFKVVPHIGQSKLDFLMMLEEATEGQVRIENRTVMIVWDHRSACTCIYDLKSFRNQGFSQEQLSNALTNAIQTHVDANWDIDGGTDSISAVPFDDRDLLVITAPFSTQLRAQNLLIGLGGSSARSSSRNTPLSNKSSSSVRKSKLR